MSLSSSLEMSRRLYSRSTTPMWLPASIATCTVCGRHDCHANREDAGGPERSAKRGTLFWLPLLVHVRLLRVDQHARIRQLDAGPAAGGARPRAEVLRLRC